MKSRIVIIFYGIFLIPVFAAAQHHGSFKKFWYVQESDTLPYRLLLPAKYDSTKKYPMVIFLHGSGERGNNNTSQLNHGGNIFTNDSIMENYPAIVMFPQCATRSSWSTLTFRRDTILKRNIRIFPTGTSPKTDMKLLMLLIKDIKQNYPVDKKRIYVGGLSMGGVGTYELVYRMPKTFAAAFVICGAADLSTAKKLKKPSWWIFHGQKDSAISVEYGKEMATALENVGAKVKLTIYPEDGHNSWDDAFKEPGLFEWMFSKKIKIK